MIQLNGAAPQCGWAGLSSLMVMLKNYVLGGVKSVRRRSHALALAPVFSCRIVLMCNENNSLFDACSLLSGIVK